MFDKKLINKKILNFLPQQRKYLMNGLKIKNEIL